MDIGHAGSGFTAQPVRVPELGRIRADIQHVVNAEPREPAAKCVPGLAIPLAISVTLNLVVSGQRERTQVAIFQAPIPRT